MTNDPTAWRTRVWREFHAGNLTRGFRDVLLTLATYGPRPWPSHETLAGRAKCCVKTVQRALQAAQGLGLVSWTERRVRAGWRWLRTSNRYFMSVPDGPIATTGQKVRGGESEARKIAREGSNAALAELMRAASRLPDLATVAARRMKALGLA